MSKVICDTGVISRYLRGNPTYIDKVDSIGFENIIITPIVRIELHRWLSLYRGLTASERSSFNRIIRNIPLIHINSNISRLAVEISDSDNSLDSADILIGSTAVYHEMPLLTINQRHFRRIGRNINLI